MSPSESGLATTEVAVLFPIVIAVVLGIVQAALWAHAGAIAQAAADHGAEVAATIGSDDGAGIDAAEDFAANAGTIREAAAQILSEPGGDFVTLRVTGSYPSLFGSLEVTATATTNRERVPE